MPNHDADVSTLVASRAKLSSNWLHATAGVSELPRVQVGCAGWFSFAVVVADRAIRQRCRALFHSAVWPSMTSTGIPTGLLLLSSCTRCGVRVGWGWARGGKGCVSHEPAAYCVFFKEPRFGDCCGAHPCCAGAHGKVSNVASALVRRVSCAVHEPVVGGGVGGCCPCAC